MAAITDITMAQIAKILFRKMSSTQRLRNAFIPVIRSDIPGATNKPKKLVNWDSPEGRP